MSELRMAESETACRLCGWTIFVGQLMTQDPVGDLCQGCVRWLNR